MKFRKDDDFSSLDLLLDTICNTFGGIVFLALLLSIIAQSAGDSSLPSDPDTSVHLELSIQDLQEDIADAEAELSRLRELVEQSGDSALPDEVQSAFSDLETARQELQDLMGSYNLIHEEVLKVGRRRIESERDIQRMLDMLRQIQEDATLTRRLPVQRAAPANMTHFWMAVHRGRLVLVDHLPSRAQLGGSTFSDHVNYETTLTGWTVVPKPNTGINFRGNHDAIAELDRWLEELPARSTIIQFMVSPDSFAEFNRIKEHLVSNGYHYFIGLRTPPYLFGRGSPESTF